MQVENVLYMSLVLHFWFTILLIDPVIVGSDSNWSQVLVFDTFLSAINITTLSQLPLVTIIAVTISKSQNNCIFHAIYYILENQESLNLKLL